MLKTAKTYPAAIYVDCPHCEASQENDDGSYMLTRDDFVLPDGTGHVTLTCQECGRRMKIAQGKLP